MVAIAEVLWDQLKAKRRTPSKIQQPFDSQSMEDLLSFLDGSHAKESDCFVCVVVHNIDGPGLRASESQQYLARVASCSQVRLVASIDHVNAPLCEYFASCFITDIMNNLSMFIASRNLFIIFFCNDILELVIVVLPLKGY